MGSERTPDLDLPALRAVIAGVRQRQARILGTLPDNFSTLVTAKAASVMKDDLTTLADACERLAEENERMRRALEFTDDIWSCFKLSALKTELVHNVKLARRTIAEALGTPAPAGSPT